ncbi:MAG: DUF1232 domain-containing protein [Anaerolineae bacterium]
MGRLLKEMMILGLGAVALLYLIYPSLGVFELIPDAIPVIGSLDEASATIILVNTLRYYGLDLARLYGRRAPQLPDGRR